MDHPSPAALPLLEVQGLTRAFDKLLAVNGLDFQLEPGEVKALIGPNGAGKTTLFNLITGKLVPSAGRIRFGGEEITGLPPHAIARRGLARSFQLLNLFPNLSVFENVRLAAQMRHPLQRSCFASAERLSEVNRQATELLERLGLQAHADRPVSQLSYGDQRSLEIGLALATKPKLLLLDEPTSGMSPLEAQQAAELIRRIAQDLSILLIEHHIDLVMALADTVLVMHYGEKIAEGPPAQVAADPRVQEAYLGGV